MKRKDCLIVALVPLALLLIPLTGRLTVDGWNWKWNDFIFAWVVFSITIFFYRLLVTRPWANLTYRLGAGLAVVAGFLITWVSLAVQIIGDENPANLLYFLVILGGFIGVGVARFQPAGLAKVAFGLAAATFLVPVIAVIAWPSDFSPGVGQVFLLNSFFVLMFAVSGLLLRHAVRQPDASAGPTPAVG